MTIAVCKNLCGSIYLIGDTSPEHVRMHYKNFSCDTCNKKQFTIFADSTRDDLDRVIDLFPPSFTKPIKIISLLEK